MWDHRFRLWSVACPLAQEVGQNPIHQDILVLSRPDSTAANPLAALMGAGSGCFRTSVR